MLLKTTCRVLDLILTALIRVEGLLFLSCSLHSNIAPYVAVAKTEGSIELCVTCGPL